MAFTDYDVNEYDLSELTMNDRQITVTNNLGRTALSRELVYLDGYFGEVMEYAGIADTASGKININHERKIRTAQIETADTFTAGNVLFFEPGSGAAGKLVDTPTGTTVAVGMINDAGGTGGAQTWVEFRPFAQGTESQIGEAVKVAKITVPTGSHSAGTPVVDTSLPVGSEIIDVNVVATATNASGTVTVSDGTNDITNAIACDTDNAISRAASIDQAYNVVVAAGLTLTANATGDAGIAYVYYK